MSKTVDQRELREQSRAAINAAIGDAADLVLVRAVGNYGDELIMEGTRALLSDRRYREISLDELGTFDGELVMLIGAGAFSRAYHEWAPWALRVAEERFERVIVLPSTFEISVPTVREAIDATRAIIFARELESYEQIRECCDARLALDGSFFYDYEPHRRDGAGLLNALRTDRDAPEDLPLPPDNADISSHAGSLSDWLDTIANHAAVRTNRAHVMIAAAMLGKAVELAPCRSTKLEALADYALRGLPLSRMELPRPVHHRLSAAAGSAEAPHTLAVVSAGERREPGVRAVEAVLAVESASAVVLTADAPGDVRAGLAAAARDEPRLELADAWPTASGAEYTLLVDPVTELNAASVRELIAGLDSDPQALLAAPAGSCGDVREWDGVVEFPPPVGEERCDWAELGALLVRTEVVGELAPDLGLPERFRAREWGYRLVQRYGAVVRPCPGALASVSSDRERPDTSTFHGRCLALPDLIAMARFYARHGLIMRSELCAVFPALNRREEGFDLGAARLLMNVLGGLGAARFLTMWLAGELDSVIGGARSELERDLGATSDLLAEIQDSRVWRLAGSYYRARGRVARRLGRPRR